MNYPESILIKKYNKWLTYKKVYEHSGNGCYYRTVEDNDPITSFISLYPDGKLTFLWNGIESTWKAEWKAA